MTLEVTTLSLEDASKEIDKIVDEAGPFAVAKVTGFTSTLKLAEAVGNLREIFLKHPGIRKTIQSMQDTKLGFLTDRSPRAIARAEQDNKKLFPYKYDEIAECCIEAMLQGYRITGNEFNVIAGGFYPAKNGKWRKIMEHPGLSDFKFTTTSPAYTDNGKFAKVQCYASWFQDGKLITLGVSEKDKGKEDTLVFTVRVNSAMGEDAVVGKAISKLFSRVLMRLSGKVLPEATDLEFGDEPTALPAPQETVKVEPVTSAKPAEPEITITQEPAPAAPNGAPTVEELKERVTELAEKAGIPAEASEIFEGRYLQEKKATWKKEADLDALALMVEQSEFVISDMKLKWKKWETEILAYLNSLKAGESTGDYDATLAKEYISKRGSGFETWVSANIARIPTMPAKNQAEIKDKWARIVKKPFPEIAPAAPAAKKPWALKDLTKPNLGNDARKYGEYFDNLVKEYAEMDNSKFTEEAFTAWFVKEWERTQTDDKLANREIRYKSIEQFKAATLVYVRFNQMVERFLAS